MAFPHRTMSGWRKAPYRVHTNPVAPQRGGVLRFRGTALRAPCTGRAFSSVGPWGRFSASGASEGRTRACGNATQYQA